MKNPLKTLHNTKKGIEKFTDEGIEGFRLIKNNNDIFFQVVSNEVLNIYHSFKKDPLKTSIDAIEYCPVVGWIFEAGDDIYKVYRGHQALRPTIDKWRDYITIGGVVKLLGGKFVRESIRDLTETVVYEMVDDDE